MKKYKIFSFLLFILIGLGAGCNSQDSNLIPREILFGNPEKRAPRISPDGTLLAFLAPDEKGVLNIWVRGGSFETDQVITSDEKRGIRSFFWGWDSKSLFYIQDRDGDENWHLYRTDLHTKDTYDLTPFEGAQAAVIAYEAQMPDQMLVQMNVRDRSLFDVYRIHLPDGALQMEVQNDHNVVGWVADHHLVIRASQSIDQNGDTVIRVREGNEAPWKEFLRWSVDEEGDLIGFSSDNRALYLLSNVNANTLRLVKADLITGDQQILAEDPQYDLGYSFMVNPKTHELDAVGVMRDRLNWIFLNPALESDFSVLKNFGEDVSVVSRDLNDRIWVISNSSDLNPGDYLLYDRETKQNKFLFSIQPKLKKYQLSNRRAISFQARDGMQLFGYLTLPLGREAKNLPTVLFVHGGPWARDVWGYDPTAQWLANRGYAVLQVNYRGSTGYGKAYLNAGNREWAGKMHTDLLDGKNWLIDQGFSNPNKVAIYGGSYGGYATLVALTFTPEEFCCGVDIVGPSNLVSLSQTIPPYWAPLKTRWNKRVGNPETEREFLESRSPLFKADRIVRPLFIAQGANDPRVKQAESDQMVDALRQKGKSVEYLLFSDEGHGFARPKNRLKCCSAAEAFLHRYLGGRYEPEKNK